GDGYGAADLLGSFVHHNWARRVLQEELDGDVVGPGLVRHVINVEVDPLPGIERDRKRYRPAVRRERAGRLRRLQLEAARQLGEANRHAGDADHAAVIDVHPEQGGLVDQVGVVVVELGAGTQVGGGRVPNRN